jgi:polyisoprenoid-binding protein YceI
MHRIQTLRTATLFALLIGAVLSWNGSPLAAKARASGSVDGTLSSLSLTAKTLTVQSRAGAQTILKLDDSSRLFRNGKRASLADLVLRDRISAQFDRATLRLRAAQARGPELATTRGRFAGWDAAARELDVLTSRGEKTFAVDSTTRVTRNGQAARPGDLRSGDALTVHSRGGRTALATDVQAEGDDEAEVEGEITAIAGNDVTLDPEAGDPVTVHVDDSTMIQLKDHGHKTAGTLADLAVGQDAEAEYDPTTMVASKIQVEVEDDAADESEVEGTLSAVDATAGTFSITPEEGGADVALTIDDQTKITLDGEPATLADLAIGSEAEAKFDPATGLASRLKVKTEDDDGEDDDAAAEIEGWVTAVSDTSITIDPRGRPTATLTLDADTQIKIDGRIKTAADISVGDEAEARYDKATMLALSLRVASHANGGDDGGGDGGGEGGD